MVAQLYHARRVIGKSRASYLRVVGVEHVRLAKVDHRQRAAWMAHVERLEITIEYKNLLAHCRIRTSFRRSHGIKNPLICRVGGERVTWASRHACKLRVDG